MKEITDLRQFSAQFKAALLERLPELVTNGWLVIRGNEHEPDGLVFEFKSPNSKFSNKFCCLTRSSGIELCMHSFSQYIDYYFSKGEEELFDYAISMIESIIREELVDVTWWVDATLRAHQFNEVPGNPELGTKIKGLSRVQIRSWHGTFDKDINIE